MPNACELTQLMGRIPGIRMSRIRHAARCNSGEGQKVFRGKKSPGGVADQFHKTDDTFDNGQNVVNHGNK